jgi:RNA ligase
MRRNAMKLWDLMDMSLYRKMLAEKYIRTNTFTLGSKEKFNYRELTILNYTEKAQFDQVWNEVTSQCRGLVIDKNFNVLARPFDKFQNYAESDNSFLDFPVKVTDKMDGSLGIIFCANPQQYQDYWRNPFHTTFVPAIYHEPWKPEWTLITRGSYDSEQAAKGRDMLAKHLQNLDPQWTYLVEIIYPENRIVVNYGDMKDLVWLGARHKETGLVRLSPSPHEWYGSQTKTFDYKTLREALECPPRANAEGYVVYFPTLDYRIKLKQDDYVALHKIVTGLTERRVWENMKEGKTLGDLLEIVPDEWHTWLIETYNAIESAFGYTKLRIYNDYETILEDLEREYGSLWTRKDFALKAINYQNSGLIFACYDDKDMTDKVWDLVRPTAE